GKTIKASVTAYEQQAIVNNDISTRDSRRYRVEYQFTVNGVRYTGSVTRLFEGGSHIRQTISVRYLPFWPHVNAEDSDEVGLIGPIMIGLGALLLAFRSKKR
ncbi:MAG: hypothetical protein Q8N36_06040, partial [bacterium]|nr:hypothetical protein [bacterium]